MYRVGPDFIRIISSVVNAQFMGHSENTRTVRGCDNNVLPLRKRILAHSILKKPTTRYPVKLP